MANMQSVLLRKLGEVFANGPFLILWMLILSGLLMAVALLVYLLLARQDQKPTKRIPGPNVHPLITTFVPLISIFRNKEVSNNVLLFQVICAYSKVFEEEGMWKFWGGFQPILILFKPETVEPILNSNEILDKGFEYDLLSPWLKEGLLASTGNKWRQRRKLLTPAFHFKILDEFIPVFNEQATVFAKKIKTLMMEHEWVDIAPLASLCTLDILCETAMGKQINAQINSTSSYVESLHRLCKLSINRLLRPWLWIDLLYFRTREGKAYKKCLQVMDQFTRQVIKERKFEKLQRREKLKTTGNESSEDDTGCKTRRRLALLDKLLDMHIKDNNSLTLEDIAEEVDNFMFAGHDTTSSGISWALYMLGLYPAIQRKAHEELDDVFGDDLERPVTLDDIKELKYINCVLKETRRLFPPTPFIARDLHEDTMINGYLIPKGTSCGILIYMLHRNPKVFPNPEVFDPERFLINNASGRHPFAYVPFSAGPRNCIGQRFATFEAIIVLATLLRRYQISAIDPLDKLHIVSDVVLRSENGLRLKFTSRQD